MVIGVLPGHKGRIGHHDHTHFIGQNQTEAAGAPGEREEPVSEAEHPEAEAETAKPPAERDTDATRD